MDKRFDGDHSCCVCGTKPCKCPKIHRSVVKRALDKPDTTELKKTINELLWTYLPSHVTIGDAEDMACEIFKMIESGKMCKENT